MEPAIYGTIWRNHTPHVPGDAMPRDRYTYSASWTAETAKGDFERIAKARSGITNKGFTRPTERQLMQKVITHLLGSLTANELRDHYCDAVADEVEAAMAAAKAAEEEKKRKRLEEIEEEAARLRAQLTK